MPTDPVDPEAVTEWASGSPTLESQVRWKRIGRRAVDRLALGLGRLLPTPLLVRYLRNPASALTVGLLRGSGALIGEGTRIKGRLYLDNASDLSRLVLGRNCYIGDGCTFDLANRVTIGDQVVLSAEVMIVTHQDDGERSLVQLPRRDADTTIGSGCWLGVRATTLVGVTMGPGSMLAAGGLLLQDTEPGTRYGGVPAKRLA